MVRAVIGNLRRGFAANAPHRAVLATLVAEAQSKA